MRVEVTRSDAIRYALRRLLLDRDAQRIPPNAPRPAATNRFDTALSSSGSTGLSRNSRPEARSKSSVTAEESPLMRSAGATYPRQRGTTLAGARIAVIDDSVSAASRRMASLR